MKRNNKIILTLGLVAGLLYSGFHSFNPSRIRADFISRLSGVDDGLVEVMECNSDDLGFLTLKEKIEFAKRINEGAHFPDTYSLTSDDSGNLIAKSVSEDLKEKELRIDDVVNSLIGINGREPELNELRDHTWTILSNDIPSEWYFDFELVGEGRFVNHLRNISQLEDNNISREESHKYFDAGLDCIKAIIAKSNGISGDDAVNYNPTFHGDLFGMRLKRGVEEGKIKKVSDEDIKIFSNRASNKYGYVKLEEILDSIPMDYLSEVYSEESSIVWRLDELEYFKKERIPSSFVAEAGVVFEKRQQGLKCFRTKWEFVDYCHKNNILLEIVDRLAGFKNSEGDPFFGVTYGGKWDLDHALGKGLEVEEIENILALKNTSGWRVINNYHHLTWIMANHEITSEEAKGFVENGIDTPLGWIYEKGIPGIHNFEETEDPNALVIVAGYDWQGALMDKRGVDFVRNLDQKYDVLLKAPSRDSVGYDTISNFPNGDLLVFLTHGDEDGLILSGKNPSDSQMIDIKDPEVQTMFSSLNPDARIFIYACHSKDFIESISEYVGGRMIFGARNSPTNAVLKVRNLYPLDVMIKGYEWENGRYHKRDMTFVLNGE